MTHYYILPDGTRAENMKEACDKLKCGSSFFKTLLKRNMVKKIEISESNRSLNTQKDEKYEDNNS